MKLGDGVSPRVCGEQRLFIGFLCAEHGSSPRVWGTGSGPGGTICNARIIPACVGNRPILHRKTRPIWSLIRPVAEKTLLTSQRAELAYITRTSIKPQPHALLAPNPAFCLSKATDELLRKAALCVTRR